MERPMFAFCKTTNAASSAAACFTGGSPVPPGDTKKRCLPMLHLTYTSARIFMRFQELLFSQYQLIFYRVTTKHSSTSDSLYSIFGWLPFQREFSTK